MPETSCVKETSVHIENKQLKQLCKHKIQILVWLSGCENFLGPSRNGSLVHYSLTW